MYKKNKLKLFSFSGIDEEKRKIQGKIEASNKKMAHYILSSIGLKKIKRVQLSFDFFKKSLYLNFKEKLNLIKHISLLLKSGIPILEAMNALKAEFSCFKIKYAIFLMYKNLEQGHSFYQSAKKMPYPFFSPIEMRLIKIGEMTGRLDISLEFIQERLEKKQSIYQKIISSSIYPLMTLFISFIVIFIIFHWVIPQFSTLFSQNKDPLPKLTQFLFSCTKQIDKIYLSFIFFILLFFYFFKKLTIKKFFSEKWHEKILLQLPIISYILKLTNKINFFYSLSILLKSGLSIDIALSESIEQMTLPYTKKQLKESFSELLSGKKISKLLKKVDIFPPSCIQIILSGEKTGNLDHAFALLYEKYMQELNLFSEQIGKMIEPFIIILLGGIIGFIVIAIYLPIFQLGGLY